VRELCADQPGNSWIFVDVDLTDVFHLLASGSTDPAHTGQSREMLNSLIWCPEGARGEVGAARVLAQLLVRVIDRPRRREAAINHRQRTAQRKGRQTGSQLPREWQ